MNCEEARALFSGKAHGRLTQDEHIALTGHLDVCPVCPREWERHLRSADSLRSGKEPQAPPGFAGTVAEAETQVPEERRSSHSVPVHIKLPVAVLAVAIFSTLLFLLYRQSPEAPPTTPPLSQVAPAPPETQREVESDQRATEEPSTSPAMPAAPSSTPPQQPAGGRAVMERREEAKVEALFQVSGLLLPRNRDARAPSRSQRSST